MDTPTIIKGINELKNVFHWTNYFGFPQTIELDMPELSESETLAYKKQIISYVSACGCGEGKVFIGMAIGIYVFSAVVLSFKSPTSYHLLNGFLFAFGGATVGKFYGLALSYLKLRKLIMSIALKYLDLQAASVA
jgi:hypothetical protein